MIDLSLDRHDFVAAVEGFARGSNLRQHVWRDIVFRNIPQMTDDEMDFFWYIFRRDLWDCYFRMRDGKMVCECGSEDYLHALAALHRKNRYVVTFQSPETRGWIKATCYRFKGLFRPLYFSEDKKGRIASFNSFIPREWVKEKSLQWTPANKYVQEGKESWWTDLSIYEKLPSACAHQTK